MYGSGPGSWPGKRLHEPAHRVAIEAPFHRDPVSIGQGIVLARGGVILLAEGTVTTFVPNPDHIHRAGVAAARPRVVSLHLYGRAMNRYHVYDVDAGTRRLIDVPHNES